MKKIFAIATTLTVAAMLVGPGTAQALTAAELQVQINALLAQLSQLQTELANMTGGGTSPGGTCTFTRNLYPGMSGADIKCLQQYLNANGHTVATSGAGSPGNETEYFGSRTQGGVQKWQDANGVAYGNYGGYFGPKSIAKYNTLGGGGTTPVCGNGVCETGETAISCAADCGTSPDAGGLTVSLASDTPAASTIADNANANFTKFILTASSSGPVKVSKIYVKRTGLTANSDVENVKIIDAVTGEYKGSIGSFNVDSRAMITFVPNLEIPAGTAKAFFIRAGIKDTTTAGKTAILGIASNDDVVSNAASVTGAPISGNAVSVVTITIGSAEVGEDGTTVDSKPDVGDTDVIAHNFYITAGSTEGITVETITAMKSGTTDISDTANIELYDVSKGKSLGEVATWSGDERATWNDLDLVINKGEKRRFQIKVDILDNPGKTINPDLVDGSDILISVKGNTYGFYITPTDNSGATWSNTTTLRGRGSAVQTINSGSLVITKSPSSPATGNVAAGSGMVLGIFDFEARGEEVKVSDVTIDFTFNVGLGDTDFTNVAIYDEDDSIVAGPVDVGSATAGDAIFSDTFIVPVGTHEYSIKATIADSASNGDQFYLEIDPDTNVTAKGMTSNESITPSPTSAQTVNTLTIAAATLTATTLSSPAARSIPSGISDYLFATFSFDAGASGEDVQVTSITMTDTMNSAGTHNCIDNAEIWADLTDANSGRGDVYETKISDTEQPSCTAYTGTAATAFVLDQTLVVPAGSFVKLAYIGDVVSGAAGTHKIYIAAATDISSTGAETGKSTSVTVVSTSAQTMTLATAGVLTVKYDEGRPLSNIILDDEVSTVASFRLEASNVENFDLDQITVSVSNGTYVQTLYFYNGDVLLGSIAGADSPTIYFADGTLTIPANSHKVITVKAKPNNIDNSVWLNDSPIQVAFEIVSSVVVTGLSSGQSDTTADGPACNIMRVFESKPVFSVASISPSGALARGSKTLLAVFDITADGTEDIIFSSDYDAALTFQIDGFANDTDGIGALLLQFEDKDGNTLDSNIEAWDSGFSNGEQTGSLSAASATVSFGTNTLTIGAGTTNKIYVYGDTSKFEDEGDYIKVWLDNGEEDIYWGVGDVTADNRYPHGDIIFRGDIFANTLTTQ